MNLDDPLERTSFAVNFFTTTIECQETILTEFKESYPGHELIAELEKIHEYSKTL